jgi:hypothetical protein
LAAHLALSGGLFQGEKYFPVPGLSLVRLGHGIVVGAVYRLQKDYALANVVNGHGIA